MFEKIKKNSLFAVILSFCFLTPVLGVGAPKLEFDDRKDNFLTRNEIEFFENVDCFINIQVLNDTLNVDFRIEDQKSLALHYADNLKIGNHRSFKNEDRKMIDPQHRKMIELLPPSLTLNEIESMTVFDNQNSQHANVTDQHISDILDCLEGSHVGILNLCLKSVTPELISFIEEKMPALPLKEVFFYLQEGNLYYSYGLISDLDKP